MMTRIDDYRTDPSDALARDMGTVSADRGLSSIPTELTAEHRRVFLEARIARNDERAAFTLDPSIAYPAGLRAAHEAGRKRAAAQSAADRATLEAMR